MAALLAAALLWIYWGSLASYLADQHYQEHFAYLWCFVALTLWRTLRGPFRTRLSARSSRDLVAVTLVLASSLLLLVAKTVGSSTGMRTSLAMLLTGLAIVSVSRWSIARCVQHGGLLLLCFGLPYSFYFPLTNHLRWGVSWILALPAELGLAGYEVVGAVVRFPHYQLEITADCSGVGQLLTFVGIAALGVLSSAGGARRALGVLALAVALAWLSNLARVALFVLLVGLGWTGSVDDPTWHSAIGFLVFLPFVAVLVAVLLRSHRPLPNDAAPVARAGRLHVAWLVAPALLVHLFANPAVDRLEEPAYFAALNAPPGHELVMVAPTQELDRAAYDTPWLVSARFQRSEQELFDLLHFRTRTQTQLGVHHVSDCLYRAGQSVRYEPPVPVDGRLWWRIALDMRDGSQSWHVYFAFEVGGERRDDSFDTQLATVYARALRGDWDVALTRVMLPGPLPEEPTDYETEVLSWLGQQTARRAPK
ncbi:MAG: archaeosortase/exosortase family protein [Planctomycetota bacterium]